MKLQFKHQPFQAEAAAAVCDVFRGQSLCAQAHRQGLGARGRQAAVPGRDRHRPVQPTPGSGADRRPDPEKSARGPAARRIASVQGPGRAGDQPVRGDGDRHRQDLYLCENHLRANARYGWSRFIIVVPSVAVREGVYRSLQTTQEHFAGEYGRRLRFFIYNSDRLAQVDRFASDSAIQVMIINMQAFNSGRNQRIIDQRPDSFRGRRPIDVIAATRPILIIDEPQSVEGRQTRESLRKFNALFTLRYSATHRERTTWCTVWTPWTPITGIW